MRGGIVVVADEVIFSINKRLNVTGGTRGGMHEEGAENAGLQGASGAYGYAITSSCTQNVSENATTAINNGTTRSQGTGANVC